MPEQRQSYPLTQLRHRQMKRQKHPVAGMAPILQGAVGVSQEFFGESIKKTRSGLMDQISLGKLNAGQILAGFRP